VQVRDVELGEQHVCGVLVGGQNAVTAQRGPCVSAQPGCSVASAVGRWWQASWSSVPATARSLVGRGSVAQHGGVHTLAPVIRSGWRSKG
jgi:hypothetical protein